MTINNFIRFNQESKNLLITPSQKKMLVKIEFNNLFSSKNKIILQFNNNINTNCLVISSLINK